MSDAPPGFAVDASVALKLFLEEEGSEKAERLFFVLAETPPAALHAPDLLYTECANVLRSRVKRRALSAAAAEAAFATLRELPLTVTPTVEVVSDALLLALNLDISVYDACYASVARRFGVPLITADDRLAEKLRGSVVKVRPLSKAAG